MLIYFFKIDRLSPPLNQYAELERMLAMRRLGYSYTVLSEHFGVPKLTIRYLVRKFGLAEDVIEPKVIRQRTTVKSVVHTYDEEVINPGKTYKEYLAEEKARRFHV